MLCCTRGGGGNGVGDVCCYAHSLQIEMYLAAEIIIIHQDFLFKKSIFIRQLESFYVCATRLRHNIKFMNSRIPIYGRSRIVLEYFSFRYSKFNIIRSCIFTLYNASC